MHKLVLLTLFILHTLYCVKSSIDLELDPELRELVLDTNDNIIGWTIDPLCSYIKDIKVDRDCAPPGIDENISSIGFWTPCSVPICQINYKLSENFDALPISVQISFYMRPDKDKTSPQLQLRYWNSDGERVVDFIIAENEGWYTLNHDFDEFELDTTINVQMTSLFDGTNDFIMVDKITMQLSDGSEISTKLTTLEHTKSTTEAITTTQSTTTSIYTTVDITTTETTTPISSAAPTTTELTTSSTTHRTTLETSTPTSTVLPEYLIYSENITNWGDWAPSVSQCPTGTFAQGFQLKIERVQGALIDDTAMNGLKLFCGNPDYINTPTIMSSVGSFGIWRSIFKCKNNGFITGFQLRVEQNGLDDETATNNIRIYCSSEEAPIEGDGDSYGTWRNSHYCTNGYGVCGLRTQVQADRGPLFDDTALNNIAVLCCRL